MKDSAGAFQYRRSKDFPHRNVYIRHTVFKNGLFFRVFQLVKLHGQIRYVVSFSKDMNRFPLIQSVDQCLLDSFIQLIIQGVDLYDFFKNLIVGFSDGRHRKGHDGKASFISRNIFIHHLSCLILVVNRQFLLLFIKGKRTLLCFRCKWNFSKHLQHCGTCMNLCQVFAKIISVTKGSQLSFHKRFIQIKRCIPAMIILILGICNGSIVSNLQCLFFVHRGNCRAVNDTLQSHVLKHFHSLFDDSLKSKTVTYIDGFLF